MRRRRGPRPIFAEQGQELSKEEYDRLVALTTAEAAFQAQIVAAAKALGWMVYHTRQIAVCACCRARKCPECARRRHRVIAKGSDPGWPDLVLGRLTPAPRLIIWELKREDEDLSDAQRVWMAILQAVAKLCPPHLFRVGLRRPSDMPAMLEILQAR